MEQIESSTFYSIVFYTIVALVLLETVWFLLDPSRIGSIVVVEKMQVRPVKLQEVKQAKFVQGRYLGVAAKNNRKVYVADNYTFTLIARDEGEYIIIRRNERTD